MAAITITLDGSSLTRAHVVAIARGGAQVALDPVQLARVQATADFLADKVRCGEPIYGVTTGFGSNRATKPCRKNCSTT
jgi:histidine ammonia-lyase